jgi:hypothetical protein
LGRLTPFPSLSESPAQLAQQANRVGQPTNQCPLPFSFPLADSWAPRVSLTHLSSPPFSSLTGSLARVDWRVRARWDGRSEPARTLSAAPEPTRPVVGWFARGNPLIALAGDAEGDVAASGGRPRRRPERIPQWRGCGHQFYPCAALTRLSHREPEPLLAIHHSLEVFPFPPVPLPREERRGRRRGVPLPAPH